MPDSVIHAQFMAEAIQLATVSFERGGGPFGALIVRDGTVIGRGLSLAELTSDPTAHAEVNAIRAAASHLKTIDLGDCIAYSSAEPCPMCLAACYWARIPRVYFGSSIADTVKYGFEDEYVYHELSRPSGLRSVAMTQLLKDAANDALERLRPRIQRPTFLPIDWQK